MGYGGVALGGPGNPITGMQGGRKVSTTPGTAVQVDSTEKGITCTGVEVQALEGNTNQICIGGSDVDETAASRSGIVLQPGESRVLYVTNLNMIWLDVQTSGDGIGYLLMK